MAVDDDRTTQAKTSVTDETPSSTVPHPEVTSDITTADALADRIFEQHGHAAGSLSGRLTLATLFSGHAEKQSIFCSEANQKQSIACRK